jgi:glycosyltransferase involved in cell wall biosynthesis
LSIALISHSLSLGQTVWVGTLRDYMVFSRDVAQAILSGQVGSVPLSGKVLRLLPASGNAHEQNLETLFGVPVDLDADGFFINRPNGAVPVIPRYTVPYLPVRAKTKPVIFVFPIFLAVGGVERNTVEIMRQLNDRFDFVVITMERLRPEQGSLAAQAIEVSAKVIEMSEIVRHADYPRVLARLKVNLQPDLVWVCNGSPWFCDNAAGIRQIFHDVPIVDQEVYDVEQGWISRYGEEGIRSFDAFVAVNKKIQERFLRDFMIAPERTYLIYSAIDTLRIRRFKQSQPDAGLLRAKFGLPDGKRIFTFVARLTPQKRPLEFLKLAKHRRVHEEECFVLVGDGELAQQALDYIGQHALGNVVRIPFVENTLELHALSDGIIFTSAYEGLPIAMIEALAMGVPAFSTDVGDIADVLAEYDGGAVVPVASSSDDVHQAFIDWLGRRNGFAANLKARENDILERFSSKNIAQQYVDCWRTAMNRYGRNFL